MFEDVTMVLDHLQHSIGFGMRHLTDRRESGHLIFASEPDEVLRSVCRGIDAAPLRRSSGGDAAHTIGEAG